MIFEELFDFTIAGTADEADLLLLEAFKSSGTAVEAEVFGLSEVSVSSIGIETSTEILAGLVVALSVTTEEFSGAGGETGSGLITALSALGSKFERGAERLAAVGAELSDIFIATEVRFSGTSGDKGMASAGSLSFSVDLFVSN